MKIDKKTVYTFWTGGIILCVALSIFALIFASCAKPSGTGGTQTGEPEGSGFVSDEGTGQNGDTVPEQGVALPEETAASQTPTPETGSGARLTETADAGREYLDKIIFLGDSTTYGIGYYYDRGYTELVSSQNVWTPASGTLTLAYHSTATVVYPETGEELSIVNAVTRAKPEYMVITLGVNGISFMDEEWFIRDYTALVENILSASPDTKIILNSMYPVAASYTHLDEINNEKIIAGNGWIEQVAEATGCRYLNSYEALVGADGFLPESCQNGDGLHLNGETFEIVMNYIRTHEYQ